jgi:hypothetical protein
VRKFLVYFKAIWNIKGHMVYFASIWYISRQFGIFLHFGMLRYEKSGNPDSNHWQHHFPPSRHLPGPALPAQPATPIWRSKQGCQMVYFQTKNPTLGKFWRALDWKMLIYFMVIWNILWRFRIFYGHWYILYSFGTFFRFWYHVP